VDDLLRPIFERVNRKVECIFELGIENQFEQLSSLYESVRNGLKLFMGTSAGWPWLGEYAIFYILKLHLEKILDCSFTLSKKPKDGFTGAIIPFVDSTDEAEYFLVHNGGLRLADSKTYSKTKDVRPDVYLQKRYDKHSYELIFTIDVKVKITGTYALSNALSKLKRTISDSKWIFDNTPKPLGYLMSLDSSFPSNHEKVHKYQESGVSIVGPKTTVDNTGSSQISSIAHKLNNGNYPMTTFEECISQIQSRLRFT
jgi:hypothetical protein